MKLLPIRIGLALGDLVLLRASLLEVEEEEQPEVVRNSAPFGFQVASDELGDELELHLDTEEDENAASQAPERRPSRRQGQGVRPGRPIDAR